VKFRNNVRGQVKLGHAVEKNSAPGKEEDRDQSFFVTLLGIHLSRARDELLRCCELVSCIANLSLDGSSMGGPALGGFILANSGHYTVAGWLRVNCFIFRGNADLREVACA